MAPPGIGSFAVLAVTFSPRYAQQWQFTQFTCPILVQYPITMIAIPSTWVAEEAQPFAGVWRQVGFSASYVPNAYARSDAFFGKGRVTNCGFIRLTGRFRSGIVPGD
jgi:hypothetical protein